MKGRNGGKGNKGEKEGWSLRGDEGGEGRGREEDDDGWREEDETMGMT